MLAANEVGTKVERWLADKDRSCRYMCDIGVRRAAKGDEGRYGVLWLVAAKLGKGETKSKTQKAKMTMMKEETSNLGGEGCYKEKARSSLDSLQKCGRRKKVKRVRATSGMMTSQRLWSGGNKRRRLSLTFKVGAMRKG